MWGSLNTPILELSGGPVIFWWFPLGRNNCWNESRAGSVDCRPLSRRTRAKPALLPMEVKTVWPPRVLQRVLLFTSWETGPQGEATEDLGMPRGTDKTQVPVMGLVRPSHAAGSAGVTWDSAQPELYIALASAPHH